MCYFIFVDGKIAEHRDNLEVFDVNLLAGGQFLFA